MQRKSASFRRHASELGFECIAAHLQTVWYRNSSSDAAFNRLRVSPQRKAVAIKFDPPILLPL